MFFFELLLSVIPLPFLLGAVLLLGIWAFLLLHKSFGAIVAVGLMSVVEIVVLLAWLMPITAAAVFNQYPLDLNAKVFPPSVENLVMPFVWVGILVSIAVAAWRGFVVKRQSRGRTSVLHVAIWTVAQLVLLSAVWCNLNNFRRMPRDPFNVESVSPNGMWTARLVPMNCWIDRNGLVIVRHRGTFWWRPVADLGDILTECNQVRFEWKTDSSGFVLLGHHPTRNEDLRLLDYDSF